MSGTASAAMHSAGPPAGAVLFAAMLLIAPVARQLAFRVPIDWPWLAPLGD